MDKSTPSRIFRPAPRRRAIVAPRFGKWARVLKLNSSHGAEAHPARPIAPTQFLGPLQRGRVRGERKPYSYLSLILPDIDTDALHKRGRV